MYLLFFFFSFFLSGERLLCLNLDNSRIDRTLIYVYLFFSFLIILIYVYLPKLPNQDITYITFPSFRMVVRLSDDADANDCDPNLPVL